MMALRSLTCNRPPEQGQFKPQGFYLNKLGRHSVEELFHDVKFLLQTYNEKQ
jgi:hypothetical protein